MHRSTSGVAPSRQDRRDQRGVSLTKLLVIVAALGILAGAAVVVASRGGGDGGGSASPTPDARPRGGTMVVAIGATSGSLNPATTSNGGVHTNSEAMFNGLLAFDGSNKVVPDLAASLPVITDNPDGTQDALFTLRPNMKWHDGSPIVADDVKFTFEEALLRGHSRTAASIGPALGVTGSGNGAKTPVDAITLPDGPGGLKVKFQFRYRYTPLLKQMNVTEAPIIPKAYFSSCAVTGGDGTLIDATPTCAKNLSPVGSGPFKFGSVNANAITLDRNPAYFKPDLPLLAKVILQTTAGPSVAPSLQAARGTAGSVDVGNPAGNLLPPTAATFSGTDYEVISVPRGTGGGNCITTLSFNLWAKGQEAPAVLADPGAYNHPILKNPAVRKAVYHAFDRNAAFNNIDFGKGRLADSPLHSALVGYTPQPSLPAFDVGLARAALQEAGWLAGAEVTDTRKSDGRPGLPPEGTPLTFDAIHFDTGTQAAYGTQLDSNLRQVGIDLNDRPLDSATTQTAMKNRTYDTTFVSYCAGDDPTIGARRQYHSTQISPVAFTNTSGYREPKATAGDGSMDDLWDRAVQATGTEASKVYGEIQTKAADLLPMIWMTETSNSRVTRSVCGGLNHQNTGLFVETAHCAL